MKLNLLRKSKLDQPPPAKASRLGGIALISVIGVWVVLFLIIRASFRLGGNPLILFILMFLLFFVALFMVRFTLVRGLVGWRRIKPYLLRLKAKFFSSNKT